MQERRQIRREVSISGRTLALLVLALSLATGMALVAWLSRPAPRKAQPAPTAPTQRTTASDPAPRLEPSASQPTDRAASAPATKSDPAAFDGRGILRGEVVAQNGATMPEHWTLLLEPHPWLEGSERAETRRIEFEHGETKFRVEDLPMGGYLVRALAGELNDVPASVLLVRGSPDQFVTLALRPGGIIDGSVLDAQGRPAEGLDVTLESLETRTRRTVTTDASGAFLFRNVQDGEYELYYGRPEAPLLPAEKLGFQAPSLRLPTRTLPGTGTLKLTVVDTSLRPQPRARVSGSAPGGSAVDVFVDDLGRSTTKNLLPGHYVLDVKSEEGLEAHASLDLAAGQELELQLVLRERGPPR